MVGKLKQPKEGEVVSNNEPKKKENPDNDMFRWFFLPENLHWKQSDFGWKDFIAKDGFKRFLTEIESKLYKLYLGQTWGQIDKKNGCGFYKKDLNKRQKQILESHMNVNALQVYHIAVNSKHRLFGYRKNGIFYIILNDPKHKFNTI